MKTATPELLLEKRDPARLLDIGLVVFAVVAIVFLGLQPALPGASLVFWFNLMKAIVLAIDRKSVV